MTAPILLDLDAIEAAAKAAGGVEWMLIDGESGIEADSRFITSKARIDNNKVPFVEIHYGHPAAGMGEPFQSEQVAAGEFVATASPAVVLELVRRLRAAEGKVSVDAAALRDVLQALIGPPHHIRELQVCRGLPDSPIDKLVAEFNAQAGGA